MTEEKMSGTIYKRLSLTPPLIFHQSLVPTSFMQIWLCSETKSIELQLSKID